MKTEICANCGHEKIYHRSQGKSICEFSEFPKLKLHGNCPCKKFVPQNIYPENQYTKEQLSSFDKPQNQSQDVVISNRSNSKLPSWKHPDTQTQDDEILKICPECGRKNCYFQIEEQKMKDDKICDWCKEKIGINDKRCLECIGYILGQQSERKRILELIDKVFPIRSQYSGYKNKVEALKKEVEKK